MPDLNDVASAAGWTGGGAAVAVAAMKFLRDWLPRRRTAEQKIGDAAVSASALIELAMKASGTSVEQLLAEVRDLRGELREAREEIERLGGEVQRCHDRESQAEQVNRSLVAVLRRAGIDLPADPAVGAFVELMDGEARVLAPQLVVKKPEGV